MENTSIHYSRAGDAFHYRWAARRCLKLLDLNGTLECIVVEGSKDSKSEGECVIDLAEYSKSGSDESVAYYQLKHTTVRKNRNFSLSEIEETFAGFAKRFRAHSSAIGKRASNHKFSTFNFITNRPISPKVRAAVKAIAAGKKPPGKLQSQIEGMTRLRGEPLKSFCSAISLVDQEGDYIVQKRMLQGEMSEYIAGFVDNEEVGKLIDLISEKVLPNSNHTIYREDVLQRLDVTSQGQLFPAPPVLEKLPVAIKREQHDDILKCLLAAPEPTIIHAAGGVGKSVVARQIRDSLPHASLGIIYDCFGAGKYRNPSEPRHRACDGIIQMANELAVRGLCSTLIGSPRTPPDALFRAFLERLRTASGLLRKVNRRALLVLLIDAADNAVMAAEEVGQRSFANDLLREPLPEGCRLVVFCRTERIHLLNPHSAVRKYQLKPFSKAETGRHLLGKFPDASKRDAVEFFRLTAGNPRVQANALAQHNNIDATLASLGPVRTTVDKQIADQLAAAIATIKDRQAGFVSAQIDAICYGLANLPPFIPVEVLAVAANVDASAIQSFISDLGRPLWHSDSAVQFRDEPTETWFRAQFGADKQRLRAYVSALEPLAEKFTYVSKTLPQLLLRCEDYERLVALALSDDYLPKDNPIDERDIRVYRLQFAFKAALRLNRMVDASRLALRAGEEVAGNQRQLKLLQENVDLIAPLQNAHKVQELAYRQFLETAWQGSENLYSASLLSMVG